MSKVIESAYKFIPIQLCLTQQHHWDLRNLVLNYMLDNKDIYKKVGFSIHMHDLL